MEILHSFYAWIIGTIAGVSIGAIVVFIARFLWTNAINKVINKLALKKLYDETQKKGIEDLKQISFRQTLEPIAKSELQKINEMADERLNQKLKEIQFQYENLLIIIKKFASYFDDSFVISNEKKEELKLLIDNSKNTQPVAEQEIIIEDLKVEENTTNNQAEDQKEDEQVKNKIIR